MDWQSDLNLNSTVHIHIFDLDTIPFEVIFPDELIEGSLEVKLPTIWTDEKQSRAEAERRERLELEERRVEEKESEERRCRCAKR